MARQQGQHKTMAEKAKEQYEIQQAKVDKLAAKAQALDEERLVVVRELNDEEVLLDYYKAHPLLELPTPESEYVPDWEDQPLPLDEEEPAEVNFKGFKGRAVISK